MTTVSPWPSLIEVYRTHEKRRARQPRGLQGYLDVLDLLQRFADGEFPSADLIARWFSIRAQEVSPTTLAYHRTVIASFSRVMADAGLLDEDLVKKVPRYRRRRRQPIQARLADIQAIDAWLRVLDSDPKMARNQRFVGLCLYTGLRLSEAIDTKWSVVDLKAGQLSVIGGKNGDDRVVTICKPLRNLLEAVPEAQRIGAVAGLRNGNPLKRSGAAHIFDRDLVRDLGVKVSPHALRRTFATRMDELGVSVRVIQDLLGHASLETTQRYLGLGNERRRNATDKLDAGW